MARLPPSDSQTVLTSASVFASPPDSPLPEMGKLAVLSGVRDFPTRVKCAGLAWHTLKAAVSGQPGGPVTTE